MLVIEATSSLQIFNFKIHFMSDNSLKDFFRVKFPNLTFKTSLDFNSTSVRLDRQRQMSLSDLYVFSFWLKAYTRDEVLTPKKSRGTSYFLLLTDVLTLIGRLFITDSFFATYARQSSPNCFMLTGPPDRIRFLVMVVSETRVSFRQFVLLQSNDSPRVLHSRTCPPVVAILPSILQALSNSLAWAVGIGESSTNRGIKGKSARRKTLEVLNVSRIFLILSRRKGQSSLQEHCTHKQNKNYRQKDYRISTKK